MKNKSIRNKALLVGFSGSSWDGRVFDKKVSADVISRHNADDGTIVSSKYLVPRSIIKKAKKLITDFRNFHYQITLPWMNDGTRILPNEKFLEYSDKFNETKVKLELASDWFVEHWDELKENAEKALGGSREEGGLYDESDFPADISGRFSISVKYSPVPTTEDFRIDSAGVDADELREQIEKAASDTLRDAQAEVWKRVEGIISRVVKFTDPDAKRAAGFKAGFTDNLR